MAKTIKVQERKEYTITVLARRSSSRAGWVAFGVETGVVVQGDSLAEVLGLAPKVVAEFIRDAMIDGLDPLAAGVDEELVASVRHIRERGIPMIFPAGHFEVIDQARIHQFLLPVRLCFEQEVMLTFNEQYYLDPELPGQQAQG